MKLLYVVTVGSFMDFFPELVAGLIAEGNTVDIATNEKLKPLSDKFLKMGCRLYHIPFSRSPLKRDNIRAIKELKKIIRTADYDIVHCQTPIASFWARIAYRKFRKNGLKVIYSAHGFHFYKGAPKLNWLVYYPLERFCSHFTDALITTNKEDYELAKRKMKAGRIEYIPGVGINVEKFSGVVDVDKAKKRSTIDVPENAFMLLSVGELNDNKNFKIVIEALGKLGNPDIHYVIAGIGERKDDLKALAKENCVNLHLLGYREDIAELCKAADCGVFPSIREGFGIAAIEQMASGLPVICSDNRGIREFVRNGKNALVCRYDSASQFAEAIDLLFNNGEVRSKLGEEARKTASVYTVERSNQMLKDIYAQVLEMRQEN